MTTTRRTFLQRGATLALAAQFPAIVRAAPAVDAARAAVELAHAEIWRRFVDQQGAPPLREGCGPPPRWLPRV